MLGFCSLSENPISTDVSARPVFNDSATPSETLLSVIVNNRNTAEYGLGLSRDSSTIAEYVASLSRDAIFSSEAILSATRDLGSPQEYLSLVLQDSVLLGECGISVIRDNTLANESVLSLTRDFTGPQEYLSLILRDHVLAAEVQHSTRADSPTWDEWTGVTGVTLDSGVPIEFQVTLRADTKGAIDTAVSILRDSTFSTDALRAILAEAKLFDEWSASASLVTSDSTLPIEWGASRHVDSAGQIEWRRISPVVPIIRAIIALSKRIVTKTPDEIKDYALNWAAEIGDDTIVVSEWDCDDDSLSITEIYTDDDMTTIWLSGGVVGMTYIVTNTILTSSGDEFSDSFAVYIQQYNFL